MMPIANPLQPPLPHSGQRMEWSHLPGASLGLALANAITQCKKTVVIITPDTLTAHRLEYELTFFQTEMPVLHFPDWETLPYDYFSPHQDIISERLSTLYQLGKTKSVAIIVPVTTLMNRLCPKQYLDGQVFLLQPKDTLSIESTRLRLEKAGYRCVNQVREHGEFAVRGSIIDIFPMGSTLPFRIDLFDDEIDSIRTFSIETQRTIESVEKMELLPAKEFPLTEDAIELFRRQWRNQFGGNPLNSPLYQDVSEGIATPGIEYYLPLFFEKTATFFDYLPKEAILFYINDAHKKAEEFWKEIHARYEQRAHDITRPLLPPEQIFMPTQDLFYQIKQYAHVRVRTDDITDRDASDCIFSAKEPLNLTVDHQSATPLRALQTFLSEDKGRVLICAETMGRREVLLQLFNSIQLRPTPVDTWSDFLNSDTHYGMIVSALDQGLCLTDPAITLIAEPQFFGMRIMQRRRRKDTSQQIDAMVKDLSELQIHAPIVHIDHGVGRYLGLQALHVGEQLTEFLCIEYAGGDKLYVPVSSLHLINRYSGAEPDHAPLHKLGTEQWQRAKRKAAEQVRDVAAELLEIYAQREAMPGVACKTLDGQYTAFAAAFPFEETPDQLQAIEQVISDMGSPKPMDRLVCGDVGFGKTEVAMRAAFIAVQNEKQVAVLVPTTLLAEQHYQNFLDRFADWPVQVEVISRFKSVKEQNQVIEKLEQGKIDIIIGTHKLLQENIKFRALGLVVVDEEHRFGVQQKERLKSMRVNADILTLTATPIPRTLNMAFSGIRDLSIIATPPARRLSVKTFVQEYHSPAIQEAILREILRGGQVYFLHNDVATIEKMARELVSLIPEARIGIAHGQMRERELEHVMSDFYHRRFNVLVCSTIIESGIDIPSANTIIMNRADKLGLAQLHQLRGRVGRSHHQAYAYLLIPSFKSLTADAKKRLDAIASLEDLGVGFTLATHDLEIRGAGELLGEGQSGNMQAIGFTLYMDLLSRAVEALKSGKEPVMENIVPRSTEIDLQIPALIPDHYLSDVELRLQFYKKMSGAKTPAELDEIQIEMIDRFGLLPEPARTLFSISMLRQRADQLGIIKIEANSKGGKIEFTDKPNIEPMKIIQLIQKRSAYFRLDGPTRLRFNLDPHERNDRLRLVDNILELLV
ncbi:MAG TPA: transcription-repair coupling factor [Gammaproteobacteria bacterium]|nr:transcription-repair coupling factor [Gammaproteobacteria bacterium]